MARYAEVEGVGTLEFPDDTPDEIIGRTVRKLVAGPRKEELQREGARTRNEARAIDLVGRALEVQTELTQGATPGGLATAAGKVLGYAGNVVAGAAEDVIAGEASPTSLGNIPNPIGPRFTAALMGEEPPRSAADTPLEQGVVDAARTLPMVAAGMVGSAAGLPVPAAFGAPMAVSAWHESRTQGASEGQSLLAGAQAGVTGAIIPGIAKAGASAAAKAMGAAVNQGWLSGSRTLAQKGAEVLAGQGAVQVFMEGLNLPTYLEATPEERKAMLIRSMAANVAFLAMDVPGLVSRQPSVTQQRLGPKAVASTQAAEVIQRVAQDPVAIDALLEAADRFALDRLSGAEWAREWVPGRRDGPGAYRPGTADSAPLPAQPEAIAEQIRLTGDPESTRAVTLVTPAEQAPEVPAGLDAVETPHGVAVFNPEKISRDEVVAAGEGERFDATVLGMADDGRVPVASDTVVTTRTPAAADVATEVVSNTPEAIAKATEAQQASVPGGITEVKPAAVAMEERMTKAPLTPDGQRSTVQEAGPGAETITGSNERRGSEMPAEVGSIPAPKPGPATSSKRRAPTDRPPDLLDDIEGQVGSIDPTLIQEANPNWRPSGAARKLFRRGGIPADRALAALASSNGSVRADLPIDQFGDAINAAARGRQAARKSAGSQKREAEALGKQRTQFEKKAIQGERPKGADAPVPVAIENLYSGDSFEVQGFKFQVTNVEFDEDGRALSVTVKDGPKFGVQVVDGAEVIQIDRNSYQPRPSVKDDFEAEEPKIAKPEGFFDKPESIEEQKAREAQDAAQRQERAAKAQLAELAAKPLKGTTGDLGQGDLLQSPEDLFAPPTPGARRQAMGRADGLEPGGPLGAEPAQPADNPNFSAFPMELPEAVRFARDLMQGAYPKVREALRILKGKALGVFRSDGLGSAEIELRADIFDLLSRDDKAKLRQEAEEYAARVSDFPDEAAGIARDRYEYLLKQAYDEAKVRNPVAALKTLWHEIGHLVDWLPDHMIQGRGNLLGRIASLKNYLRHTLPMEPGGADRPVTPAERERLRRQAEKQLRDELGPIREIIETVLVEEPIYRTTGVTPDQVKALFGMDARESMPDLYAWFVSQPAETKKDIVRKAMKGIVDDRLASITTQERIGTRTTERVVRKVSGREPTQAEIVARFRELLRKEMAARRMADLETLKSELRPMIAWWRGTAEMEDYFKPSPEMYAEAFSVFMNNPAAVARRAPTYYRLMHSYMERKPAVQAVYDQIQDQIKSGTIMRERVGDLRATWRKDNETSVERMVQRLRTRGRDLLDNILYHVDRRFGPVYRAAAGTSRDPAIRKAVGDFTYRAAEHERFLGRINDRVGSLLMANNLDWNDLGEYLFHQRIIQERFNMANPLGWTSKNSLERVAEMKATLGPTAFGRLEEAATRFRKQYEDQVLPLMREARLWGSELQQKIDANVWYATFAAVQGLPDSGIERALQLSYGSSVTPHIYRQIGMLGEIKNPATATVLKALSLMSAAHRNIAKREIVTMLRESHPEEILEAERRWTGKGWEPVDRQTDRVGTITYLEDGKPLSFYVPRLMADAVNGGAAVENRLAGAMMRAQSWQKGLFTQLNYGFWPVNFMRDSLDWWLKMPGVGTPAAWVARLPRAIAAARSSVKGRPNPVADDALRRLMLIAREDPSGVLGDAADEFEAKVASYGMNPVQWDKTLQGGRVAIGIWNRYRELGQTMERVNKIAGMLYLDEKFPDLPEWKKREMVRERAGSPDFMQRGAWKGGLEFAFLFYNAWKQGVRATVNAARDNPWSFAAKAGAGVAVPSVLMAAAARGIFGDDLEEAFRSIPDYDLTNYLVVPLQWADRPNGKVMYLRLPLPDPMRLMHGTLFKTLTDRGEGYAAFWGGQVPGLNPLLQVAGAWSMYAMGNNPPDLHTGRPILDDTTFAAGGAPATAEMGKWTWNSLGGGIIHRFRNAQLDAPPTTETERLLAAPGVANVMGRWIKVSNRGLMDEDRRQTKDLEQYRAQARLAVRSLLNRWADAGLLEGVLQPMAAGDATTAARRIIETEMSPAERRLLREPYAMEHLLRTLPEVMRSRSSALMQRVQRAPSKDAKVMILSNEVQRATGGR